ncbi:hypothetical protein HYH03_013342 [Edaphochlamys debaryana]|uniref:t-SNARE coiled-coil homology domain-containing protein n=1 Tax=Edaphochlamys debaryana TaxID=47281 RepID=A0A836BT01_9CHLO|nr:hypothetical protein HYH03_013342 [Edaphochlamys debaryana]|eukprot:KAG2488036.1 hypothetical protein HYH03_013342 [Edaphochlamys debaryana]
MSFQDLARNGGRELSSVSGQGGTREVEALIFKLAGSVSQLRKLVDLLGTAKDTLDHRHRITNLNTTIHELNMSIKDKLTGLCGDSGPGGAGAAGPGPGSSSPALEQQQLKAKRLLQDFASILQDYKATQKLAAEREAASLPRQVPKARREGPDGLSAPLLDVEAGGGSSGRGRGADVEAAVRQQAQRQAEVAALDDAVAYNEALIEERDAGIAEIQRQIGEVNEMFQDLAVLIADQGEQLETVEEHITTVAERVKEGTKELVVASRSSRAARNRCLCIWLIAAVIVSILIIIVAV